MPGFYMRPAYVEGSGTPLVRHYPIKSGTTPVKGMVLQLNAGELEEATGGATVTGILGTAIAQGQSAAGYGMANDADVTHVAGRTNSIPVAIAQANVVFIGEIRAGVTTTVGTPAAANLRTYGMVKQADGTWTVDSTDTTDVVLRVIRFDAVKKLVWFKFIPSAVLS